MVAVGRGAVALTSGPLLTFVFRTDFTVSGDTISRIESNPVDLSGTAAA